MATDVGLTTVKRRTSDMHAPASPLHYAIMNGKSQEALKIIRNSGIVYLESNGIYRGRCNLVRAIVNCPDHLELIKTLVNGATLAIINLADSESDQTPLIAAASQLRPDILKLLLDKKADPNTGNACQLTPLLVAVNRTGPIKQDIHTVQEVARKMLDVVQMLFQHGAAVNSANCIGDTPLQQHIDRSSYAFPSVITYLVQKGAVPPFKQRLSPEVQKAVGAGFIMRIVEKHLPEQRVIDIVHDYVGRVMSTRVVEVLL